MPWERYRFYLYTPPGAGQRGSCFLSLLPGVKPISLDVFETLRGQFTDLGEINPDYSGFKTLEKKFILLLCNEQNSPCGYCVFIADKLEVIEIDIILVRKELRRRGLGRLMLGYLEQACRTGTVIYVNYVTAAGRKFFIGCGFARDVDLFKVLRAHNRIFPQIPPVLACG